MNQNTVVDKKDEIEIDLQRLFKALLKRAWIIVITSILGAVISFFATFFFFKKSILWGTIFYVHKKPLHRLMQGYITFATELFSCVW